jgi:hypothetical protein
MLGLLSFFDFAHSPILKKITFRKPDILPSSGVRQGTPTLLGPLERVGLKYRTYWTMDKDQNSIKLLALHHYQNHIQSNCFMLFNDFDWNQPCLMARNFHLK